MAALSSLKGGIGDDPKELTPKKMAEWNMLLDYMKKRGYEGSTQLDKDKALGQKIFNDFKKENPSVSITYDIVPTVQMEMQKLKQTTQAFLERRKDPNAKAVMSNVSKVDGFLGSKTSQFRFPNMTEMVSRNNAVVSNKNLGLVEGTLRPTGIGAGGGLSTYRKPLPKGAKLEEVVDASGNKSIVYQDESGDLIKYQP